jgi:hypothetical protein
MTFVPPTRHHRRSRIECVVTGQTNPNNAAPFQPRHRPPWQGGWTSSRGGDRDDRPAGLRLSRIVRPERIHDHHSSVQAATWVPSGSARRRVPR